ncbi:monovalent cation/H+ antiporter subunit D [Aquabacterium sp. J223]|uniref:monovalent cation/H+ antiporter subunit D n=1 Tax=Aquabacterium sp. J223 TaxID=2898431 RepID=UPI0021ADA137|nr:monovalent cation/H+ antiporter subunit D [Aquabacterium sp. J223]UUX94913.1 monovalent cation/H+ antiporter subunit D [Aquabacterium sp. J223]
MNALVALLDPHLAVLPVLLPLATACLLLALGDAGAAAMRRARALSLVSALLGLGFAWLLTLEAAGGELRIYRLGDWPAPFGIVLVVDRLAALMLLLTQCVALPALLYAGAGWDTRGRHFHALFHLQLMGLAGAFVTGDVFNLFVFFEVLLIASYVLLVHGQGRERLRWGVPYVVLNLAASALFLIGVALLYAHTGTLNLADLMRRVPQVTGAEAAMLQAGALLLLVVFGFKAALLPLHLWLPGTYAAASAPVAALFAIMTKVGVYAIVRVHLGVFGDGAGESSRLAEAWLLPLALASSVLAVLGAMAAGTLPRLVAWLTVVSVGTALVAVGLFSTEALAAGLYYTVHSTLVIALLFLLAELIALQRGAGAGRLQPAGAVSQPALLGLLLLLAAASVAGLPPLPGFLGKVMILQATPAAAAPWVWTVVLGVGFLSLLTLSRAGSVLFWAVDAGQRRSTVTASGAPLGAVLLLSAALVGMTLAAEPIKRYTDAAAAQLEDRAGYVRAVFGEAASTPSTRPYVGDRGAAR